MLMGHNNNAAGMDAEMVDEQADKENQSKEANKAANAAEDADSQDLLEMVEKQGIVVKNYESQQVLELSSG